VTDGEAKFLSTSPGDVSWSADGRWIYVTTTAGRSTGIELRPGQSFPAFPADGADAVSTWLKLPGARPVEQLAITAVSDPSGYVFQKVAELRNLFRIPVPEAR
jgi:hypothetical protein